MNPRRTVRTSTDMNLRRTVRTFFIFLLLALLHTAAEAQICSLPESVTFPENNPEGAAVVTIPADAGVTLTYELRKPENIPRPFRVEGTTLIATEVLDYEKVKSYTLLITCLAPGGTEFSGITIVVVGDLNDNPPVFDKSVYDVTVDEFSRIGTSIGRFAAEDLDSVGQLSYTLTSESNYFELESPIQPNILVQKLLDYDKVKNVQLILTVQDSPPPSKSATATVRVTVRDVDNRPPWFQPCRKFEVGATVICQNSGYTGNVNLNEQEPGVLPLKPEPLYAIDGDSGRSEALTYSFLSGNEAGLFAINANTGNITMNKAADVLGTITLTVVAAQTTNSHQFSTTSVRLSVQVKSLHPPQFESPQYEAVITSVGAMAMDLKDKDKPLRILARDEDYAAAGGLNPHITYNIDGNSDFSIIDGFLFMTKDVPEGTLSLQVVAEDTSNSESATARLIVEVTSGLTTTSLPPSTTDITTTNSETTEEAQSTTNPSTTGDSTSSSGLSTEGSISTTNPSSTSEESVSSGSTAQPHTDAPGVSTGGFSVVDMAALGATLGVLLFVCLVVIIVLALQIRKGKADWRKIYETSMFRSSLGQGSAGQKEGIQYTNEGFQHDEDEDGGGSSGVSSGLRGEGRSSPLPQTVPKSSSPPPDDEKDEKDEKEVKPILTKERRMEDGYKAVWFKEDIDPDAKEEVVIIPDNGGEEQEEEEEDDAPMKIPKVAFADTDMDSGLGVRMEEHEDDSEEEGVMTSDL